MIEEALFGEFTRGKSRMHKTLASHIFQSSVEISRERLLNWITHPNFNHVAFFQLCQTNSMEIDDYLRAPTVSWPENTNPPAWSGRLITQEIDPKQYTFWFTVYLRINCAQSLAPKFDHPKIKQFVNAHIPIARYLDSLEDPRDDSIEFPLPYTGLGKSHYDNDRNAIEIESFSWHETRPLPLTVLRAHYPSAKWTIEELMPELNVLDACLYLTNQCKTLHATESSANVRDALWFYHACFIDYFYNYKPEYKYYMPVELYPFDNRAFTAYDLPSAFHVLAQIPLWGEQSVPAFPLGKFIQKLLPFAGARRTLIGHTEKLIRTNEAFWKVFSSVFYCMLLDMYPEDMSGDRNFDMNRLLRMKQIASDREAFRHALTLNGAKENDKGCFVVFTAFRLWLVMMTKNQPHFKQVIDWDAFEKQSVQMGIAIRNTDLTDETDIFAEARSIAKQYKMTVYRYRKSTLIDSILEKMTESLEKDLYKQIEKWKCEKPAHISQIFLNRIDMEIETNIKTNILNTLIRVPAPDWLNPVCLSMLRVPEYGGIRKRSVKLILNITEVYYVSAKPKDFEELLNQFHVPDFKVICWYFHVISMLGKIDFESLTMDQVVQIDQAMINRYTLFPGQALPSHAFNVFYTLCCGKIKTLQGTQEFGHRDIAYDMERNIYVCAKSHKKNATMDADDLAFSEFETQRKNARKQRKEFNKIPCNNNPVLCIPLRGFKLLHNKTDRYMHCPKCGSFHKFQWTGYQGSDYMCPECQSKTVRYCTCTVCGLAATETWPVVDPTAPVQDVFQNLYFCKKHLTIAKKAPTKQQLYKK